MMVSESMVRLDELNKGYREAKDGWRKAVSAEDKETAMHLHEEMAKISQARRAIRKVMPLMSGPHPDDPNDPNKVDELEDKEVTALLNQVNELSAKLAAVGRVRSDAAKAANIARTVANMSDEEKEMYKEALAQEEYA